MVILYSVLCIVYILHFFRLRDLGPLAVAQSSPPLIRHWRQSNSKFRPEKTGIISISLTLACSILKSLFRFNLTGYMSWWRWMVSDSNKFVLIRSEGKGSVGKQLVLRTASTYQLLVKAPSSLHWDWLLKWWGCTVQQPSGALWSSGCKSQALTRLPVSRIVIYRKGAKKIFLISISFDMRYVRSDTLKF